MSRSFLVALTGAVIVALGLGYFFMPNSLKADELDQRIPLAAREQAVERSNEVPAPEDSADVDSVAYLRGSGAFVMVMHDIALAQVQARGRDVAQCQAQVGQLNARGPQDVTADLISGVADEPLRAFFESERATLAVLLARCLNPSLLGGTQDPLPVLIDSAALAEARLHVIGWWAK